MASKTSCVYKTVQLKEGETYSLPSNAEILYVSNSSNIISTCGDLPETDSSCYIFRTPMAGFDVDNSSPEFYAVGFEFDDLTIELDPAYTVYGSLGTCVESINAETAQAYVNRLNKNIWFQLPQKSNGNTIIGMSVIYQNFSAANGGDVLEIMVHIPNIFTTKVLNLIDKNNQGVKFQVVGELRDSCTITAASNLYFNTQGVLADDSEA